MKTEIKKIDAHTLELTVDLTAEELKEYVKKTQQQAQQEITVEGFRKGKAPEHLTKDRLDQQKILEFAMQDAVHDSLSKAIKENKIDVLHSRDLKVKQNNADKLTYTVTITTYPAFELPDISQYKVKANPIEVTDTEIEDALKSIRNMRATFSPKEGVVAEGDRVEVDFKVTLDGKDIKGGESKSHPLIVGGKSFMPGFEEALIGLKKDEEKKFSLTAPEDYYQKDLAGKKLDFDVKITNVQNVNMPEASDEFAKTIGKFETLDQLKASIKEGIAREKEEKEKQRVRLAILDKIIEGTKFDVPESLIEEQLDIMVANFDGELHSKGMELAMYLAHIGKSQDDLRKDWHKDAIKQAKISLVLHKLAQDQEIIITPEEVDLQLNDTIQALVSRGQADLNSINPQELRQMIADQMLNEKTMQYLEKKCSE